MPSISYPTQNIQTISKVVSSLCPFTNSYEFNLIMLDAIVNSKQPNYNIKVTKYRSNLFFLQMLKYRLNFRPKKGRSHGCMEGHHDMQDFEVFLPKSKFFCALFSQPNFILFLFR